MGKKLPKIWNDLLLEIEDKFLKEVLSDIERVNIGNMISTDVRMTFKTNESFKLFNLSIRNENSRKVIEKLFVDTFGKDISIVVDPPNNLND